MATTATVRDGTFDGETLTATVELAFGDGSAYDPGQFGAPSADQFALTVAGQSVDTANVSVTSQDDGTYSLTAEGVSPADGDTLSVAFADEKAGATHTTTADTTTIEQVNDLGVSVTGTTVSPGGTGTISIDATAVTEVQVTDCWTDWSVTETTAAGGSFDSSIDNTGICRFSWSQQQSSVAPSVTFSLPDRYVGGEYVLSLSASDGEESVKETARVTVQE